MNDITGLVVDILDDTSKYMLKCTSRYYNNKIDLKLSQLLVDQVVLDGHFDLFKHLISNGYNTSNNSVYYSIVLGRLNFIKYIATITELECELRGIDVSLTALAAYYGHLDILKYLHTNDFSLDEYAGRLNMDDDYCDAIDEVEYDEEHLDLFSDKSDHDEERLSILTGDCACLAASVKGNLECLKYCYENECDKNENNIDHAGHNDHLECVKFLCDKDYFLNEHSFSGAARNGHSKIIKFAHDNNLIMSGKIITLNAALSGNLDLLKYLHSNGYEWDPSTTWNASREGHLDCLIYAHTNGCPIDTDCMNVAVHYSNLNTLRYLYESGVRCDDTTFERVFDGLYSDNSLKVIRYMIENKFTKYQNVGIYAIEYGKLDTLVYSVQYEYFNCDYKTILNALDKLCQRCKESDHHCMDRYMTTYKYLKSVDLI